MDAQAHLVAEHRVDLSGTTRKQRMRRPHPHHLDVGGADRGGLDPYNHLVVGGRG